MPITYYQEDKWTGIYSLEPDKKIWGISVYLISRRDMRDEFLFKCIKSWRLVEVEYLLSYSASYFAKKGIKAEILRVRLALVKIYWWFLREIFYKRLHLIDPKTGCIFTWKKDFKPLRFILRIIMEVLK